MYKKRISNFLLAIGVSLATISSTILSTRATEYPPDTIQNDTYLLERGGLTDNGEQSFLRLSVKSPITNKFYITSFHDDGGTGGLLMKVKIGDGPTQNVAPDGNGVPVLVDSKLQLTFTYGFSNGQPFLTIDGENMTDAELTYSVGFYWDLMLGNNIEPDVMLIDNVVKVYTDDVQDNEYNNPSQLEDEEEEPHVNTEEDVEEVNEPQEPTKIPLEFYFTLDSKPDLFNIGVYDSGIEDNTVDMFTLSNNSSIEDTDSTISVGWKNITLQPRGKNTIDSVTVSNNEPSAFSLTQTTYPSAKTGDVIDVPYQIYKNEAFKEGTKIYYQVAGNDANETEATLIDIEGDYYTGTLKLQLPYVTPTTNNYKINIWAVGKNGAKSKVSSITVPVTYQSPTTNLSNYSLLQEESLKQQKTELEKALKEDRSEDEKEKMSKDLDMVKAILSEISIIKYVTSQTTKLPDTAEPDDIEEREAFKPIFQAYESLGSHGKDILGSDTIHKL